MGSDDAPALFTVDDVLRLVAEREAAAARLLELDAQVAAFRTLLGDERFSRLTGQSEPKEPPSFREVMESALADAAHGLTYDQLRDALRDGGLAEALERSPNNFFNTVGRLIRLERAVKIGERVITPAALEKLPADVRSVLESEGEGEGSSTPDAVKAILKKAQMALTPAQVIQEVAAAYPEMKPQRVYAAISRLTKNDEIARDEHGRYFVPANFL